MSEDGEETNPGVDPRRMRRRAISESASRDQVDIVLIELEYAATPEEKREILKRALGRSLDRGRAMGTTDLEQAYTLARREQTQRQSYEVELHELRFGVMEFLRSDMGLEARRALETKLYGKKEG